MTIVLSVVSIAIALVLGAIFGLCRVSTNMFVRGIGTTYVDIFRGTPLLVQAFFIYFGIPAACISRCPPSPQASSRSRSTPARTWLKSSAAASCPSTRDRWSVTKPGHQLHEVDAKSHHAAGNSHDDPSYINQFVITLKDTSILSVIGLAELTQTGRIIIARNFQSFNMWLIIGVMYFIIIMALTKLSNRLEKRINK